MAVRFEDKKKDMEKVTLREGTVLYPERIRSVAARALRRDDWRIVGICEDLLQKPDATIYMLNNRLAQAIGFGSLRRAENQVIRRSELNLIDALLEIGINPNRRVIDQYGKGRTTLTPYERAIEYYNVDVVEKFARHGATQCEHLDRARNRLRTAPKGEIREAEARRILRIVESHVPEAMRQGAFVHERRVERLRQPAEPG